MHSVNFNHRYNLHTKTKPSGFCRRTVGHIVRGSSPGTALLNFGKAFGTLHPGGVNQGTW